MRVLQSPHKVRSTPSAPYCRTIGEASRSFGVVLLKRLGDACAVHEDDLPCAPFFLQESRFQPLLVYSPGGIGYAPFVDVGDPGDLAEDYEFRVMPFVVMQFLLSQKKTLCPRIYSRPAERRSDT